MKNKNIILTFDIEEWPIYVSRGLGNVKNLDALFDSFMELLEERGIKATCFCLGELAIKYPHIVKRIAQNGHEIGCHSYSHRWLNRMTMTEFEEDTKQALDAIENITGEKVRIYRAPAFTIGASNPWTIPILEKFGIEIDCSIFPAYRAYGGFPGFKAQEPVWIKYGGARIKEFPVSMVNLGGFKTAYSGGGYFRLFPYPVLRKFFRSNPYVVTYFHMRDFDIHQHKTPSLRYFQKYYGINKAKNKFLRMLDDFTCLNIQQAEKSLDWDKVKEISLDENL